MKRMFVRVRAGEPGLAIGVRSQNMVIDEQAIVTECLGSLRVVFDLFGVVAEFGMRKDDTIMHRTYSTGLENRSSSGLPEIGARLFRYSLVCAAPAWASAAF